MEGCSVSSDSKVGIANYMYFEKMTLNSASIENFNWISAVTISLGKTSRIGKLNRIKELNDLILLDGAVILARNGIYAPERYSKESYFIFENQNLVLGRNSEILRKNYMDCTGSIRFGNNVVLGGNGSEFWTHAYNESRNIKLGDICFLDDIFVGSSCIFNPGIEICSNVIIAPGSVVYKSICEPGLYSSHNMLKKK